MNLKIVAIALLSLNVCLADVTFNEVKALFDSSQRPLTQEEIPEFGSIEIKTVVPQNSVATTGTLLFLNTPNKKGKRELRIGGTTPETIKRAIANRHSCEEFVPPAVLNTKDNALETWENYETYRRIGFRDDQMVITPTVRMLWRISKDKDGREILVGRGDILESGWHWNSTNIQPMTQYGAIYYIADSASIERIVPDPAVPGDLTCEQLMAPDRFQKVTPYPRKAANTGNSGVTSQQGRLPPREKPANNNLIHAPDFYRRPGR